MKIGIPREVYSGECRVAATPDTAKKLIALGFDVMIESDAGSAANLADEAFVTAGCQVVADASALWSQSDIVLKVRPPMEHPQLKQHEADLLTEGKVLISFLWPSRNKELLNRIAGSKATAIAMDSVPRISRAQKLDALSSMANVSGYRAVVEAAAHFDRFFPGQITAAGKVTPAKVMVIGAGVAGLAAIGAAKNLGAIVRAFDTRPAVKEQVESMGAEFLEVQIVEDGTGQGGYAKVMSPEFIKAEMELFAEQAREVDIIITTALIPGVKAPTLITRAMVESMRQGSVIVDLAAEEGGNCELTRSGEVYRHNGVTIIGLTDLASRMAQQASQLYGTNLWHLLSDMGGNAGFKIDMNDEVVRGALVIHKGEITWPPPKVVEPAKPAPAAKEETKVAEKITEPAPVAEAKPRKRSLAPLWMLIGGAALFYIGYGAPETFLAHFTVFVLACFVGWQVIWNVKPALHTPLMSVTNAISGIIIIGGMLQISGPMSSMTTILGAIAIFVGTINIAGGFLVTQRMLKMFQR
jgi:H+-translocating NAD(P) transhydrogenase subunit alpha